jgi:hypothetical protein
VKIRFCDRPEYIPSAEYDRALLFMRDVLVSYPDLNAVYQVGGIGNPGISDIDLVAVFENGAVCREDPLGSLPRLWRTLFCHGIYGVSRADFAKACRVSFFQGFRLVWGSDQASGLPHLTDDETAALKTQIALEYLFRWFVSLTVERTYRIIRLRGLFLHTKAALQDLDFLGVREGNLREAVLDIIQLRNLWFQDMATDDALRRRVENIYAHLKAFLWQAYSEKVFFAPRPGKISLARHLVIIPAAEFAVRHMGLTFPPSLVARRREYFNLQHRFNRFRFYLPLRDRLLPPIIQDAFSFHRKMGGHNRVTLPHFLPLSTSLNWHYAE